MQVNIWEIFVEMWETSWVKMFKGSGPVVVSYFIFDAFRTKFH